MVKASVVGGGGGDEQGEQSESEKKNLADWSIQFYQHHQIPVFHVYASKIVLFSIWLHLSRKSKILLVLHTFREVYKSI